MSLKYFCDRKGCERELKMGNHEIVTIDGRLYDLCRTECLQPFADMKRAIDSLGQEHEKTYSEQVKMIQEQFLAGKGREAH